MHMTIEQVKAILASNSEVEAWYPYITNFFQKYKINNMLRVAAFFAQTAHESRDFNIMEENLNYSANGLDRVFAKYFIKSGVDAKAYARQPEKIANYVYGNRMGNGGPESGDGWKYRGGGIIQLTGKNNYAAFSEAIGMSLDDTAAYVRTKQGALESACWFWSKNGLNELADKGDIVAISKRINGGTNGLKDRKDRYRLYMEILGDAEGGVWRPAKKGDKGEHVRSIQRLLNVPVDGDFGPTTLAAVKKFQVKNGLSVDGIVGPKTLEKLRDINK